MNRVKNAQSWYEIIGLHAFRLRQQRLHVIPDNIIWIQHTATLAGSQLGPISTSGTYRLGDSWETLTYTALGLCGLIAIGLSWI